MKVIALSIILSLTSVYAEEHKAETEAVKERPVFLVTEPTESEKKEPIESYMKGRMYSDIGFQYRDANDKWWSPKYSYEAKQDGLMFNKEGDTQPIKYKKGDVIFQTSKFGWFVAPPLTPEDYVGYPSTETIPNYEEVKDKLTLRELFVVHFTNKERMRLGLKALKVSLGLMSHSRNHNNWMSRGGGLNHGGPGGGFGNWAENIAEGDDSKDVVNRWIKSHGHYENMKGNYNFIGVGIGSGYATQQFGR